MTRKALRTPLCTFLFVLAAALFISGETSAQDRQPEEQKTPPPSSDASESSEPKQNPDGPFKASEVTKKAVITRLPNPRYTPKATQNKVYGVVRLHAVLSSTGEVTNIRILKGLPDGLSDEAIEAARKIEFTPAQKDDRRVSQWVLIEYNFNTELDEEDVEEKAVILEKPEPKYTGAARIQKIEGRVVLKVKLFSDGSVGPILTLAGLPYGLTERAIEAARKIKFKPARDKGVPVDVYKRVEYVFRLHY